MTHKYNGTESAAAAKLCSAADAAAELTCDEASFPEDTELSDYQVGEREGSLWIWQFWSSSWFMQTGRKEQ